MDLLNFILKIKINFSFKILINKLKNYLFLIQGILKI